MSELMLPPARLVAPWWRRLWARLRGPDDELAALLLHERAISAAIMGQQSKLLMALDVENRRLHMLLKVRCKCCAARGSAGGECAG